jgi:hypothetical protein
MERLSIRLPLFTDSIFLSAKRSGGGFLTNASEAVEWRLLLILCPMPLPFPGYTTILFRHTRINLFL